MRRPFRQYSLSGDGGLCAVTPVIVEGSTSLRIVEGLYLRFIGGLQISYAVDERLCNRIWFDILASDHQQP